MSLKFLTALLVSCLSLATIVVFGGAAANPPTYHTFEADGVTLRYLTAGERGSTVVLLHGIFLDSDVNWRLPGTIKELAKSHRVVALDFPGHGGSDRPQHESAYGRQMARDVALLLDHLKVDRAHIVGYSMGGMVALRFLADYPERSLSGTIAGMGWMEQGSERQEFWEQIPRTDGGILPTACPRSLAMLALTEDELRAIKLPVTVIVGDRDIVFDRHVEPLRRVRENWPVVIIPGAGHLTCIIRKDFVDAVVRSVED